MIIPKLQKSKRTREYKLYSELEIFNVVYEYLYNGLSHREIDKVVLGLNKINSRGYQTMGILHFLGLTGVFKGIFKEINLEESLDMLRDLNDNSYQELIAIIAKKVHIQDNSYSWTIESDFRAEKKVEKSELSHKALVIPSEIRPFFNIGNFLTSQNQKVILVFGEKEFNANFISTNNSARILWCIDFENEILKYNHSNREDSTILMIFERLTSEKYQVSFENENIVYEHSDLQTEILVNTYKKPVKKKTSSDSLNKVNYIKKAEEDNKTGFIGEIFVLAYEKKELVTSGKQKLADKVEHISVNKGDGEGYDIKSFTGDGEIKYIEVKTSKGSKQDDFYMSLNEWEFAKNHRENYYLYRVYNINKNPQLVIFRLDDIERELDKIAIQYIFTFKPID